MLIRELYKTQIILSHRGQQNRYIVPYPPYTYLVLSSIISLLMTFKSLKCSSSKLPQIALDRGLQEAFFPPHPRNGFKSLLKEHSIFLQIWFFYQICLKQSSSQKTEGPRAYSRYIGRSARAEWPTFLPSQLQNLLIYETIIYLK